MRDVVVPPAPTSPISGSPPETTRSQRSGQTQNQDVTSAPRTQSPLDAAFLQRVYRSMLWVGLLMTALAAFATKSVPGLLSLVSGFLLAAALLRLQEVAARSVMRPKEQLAGFDARLIMVVLLPLKFLAIGAVLFASNALGLLQPALLALGFFAGQLVIMAKVAGCFLRRSATSSSK